MRNKILALLLLAMAVTTVHASTYVLLVRDSRLQTITGFGAVALHMLVQWLQVRAGANVAAIYQTPVLGASGAVYGVLIGYAMLFPNDRMTLLFPPVTLKAKWMMLIFAGIELMTGAVGTADGVAHFAHLGGMLFGALLIIWWRKTGRLSRW